MSTFSNTKSTVNWALILLPGLLVLLYSIAASFYLALDVFYLFIVLIALALFAIPILSWLLMLVIAIFQHVDFWRWKNMASFVLSLIFLVLSIHVSTCNPSIGDYIHLAIAYPVYKAQINENPNKRLIFNWRGYGLFYSPDAYRKLVYDPSDVLPIETKKENDAFIVYDRKGQAYHFDITVADPLIDHFYLLQPAHY